MATVAAAFLIHGGGGGSFLKLKKQSHRILGIPRPLPPGAKNIKLNSLKYNKNHDYCFLTTTTTTTTESPMLRRFGNTKSDDSRNQQYLPDRQAFNLWENSLLKRALRKSAVAALLLLGLLVTHKPKSNWAMAAPMGRVGGSWYQNSSTLEGIDEEDGDPADTLVFLYIMASIISFIWVMKTGESITDGVLFVCVLGLLLNDFCQTPVFRLQVCVSDSDGQLQTDLNRIAETADTSSREGLRHVLDETLLALRGRKNCYISLNSSKSTTFGTRAAQRYIAQLSSIERMYNKETLVNFNNMKSKSQGSLHQGSAIESNNDKIMVTILLTFYMGHRDHLLPSDDDSYALKKWMKKELSSENVQAVEVLWTPQVSSSAVNYPSQCEVVL